VREEFAIRIRTIAGNIETRAKARVRRRSGALEASIETVIREDGLQATVGTPLHYAKFVEFGTVNTRKRPFLYPAFRTSVRDFRKEAKAAGEQIKTKVKRRYKGPKKP
jgi:HK97 gp10 family phage protein